MKTDMFMDSLYLDFIRQALQLLMVVGSGFTLIIGLLLLIVPGQLFALEQRANRWVSLRRRLKPLEISHNIDPQLYRLHRPLGLFILLSCTYILYQLAFNFDTRVVTQLFATSMKTGVITEWLVQAFLLSGIILNLLLIPFGALLALRPSRLKGLEGWANRWVSTRKALQPLERPYTPLDNLVKRYPRIFGAIIMLFSLYNLYFFLLQLLKNTP